MQLVMPAEWGPQQWLWIGFPHDLREWGNQLARAQEQIAGFASAVADSGQEVRLLVRDEANEARARALCSAQVRIERRVYGDIWLRDTGPIGVFEDGQLAARRFAFNGWGGKYCMAGDETIGARLARYAGLMLRECDWVLEGGAIDSDGTGRLLTTEQCLLARNRNPSLSRLQIEALLARDLGASEVIWLGAGLINDHTDGHVDNLARFVAPGRVVIARAEDHDDPNRAIYADARARSRAASLKVETIPSPGRIEREGQVEPASYANFAITSRLVVVPTFGVGRDAEAVAEIGALFGDRETIGLPADAVLAGGGGFHCASQHMPAPEAPRGR